MRDIIDKLLLSLWRWSIGGKGLIVRFVGLAAAAEIAVLSAGLLLEWIGSYYFEGNINYSSIFSGIACVSLSNSDIACVMMFHVKEQN